MRMAIPIGSKQTWPLVTRQQQDCHKVTVTLDVNIVDF